MELYFLHSPNKSIESILYWNTTLPNNQHHWKIYTASSCLVLGNQPNYDRRICTIFRSTQANQVNSGSSFVHFHNRPDAPPHTLGVLVVCRIPRRDKVTTGAYFLMSSWNKFSISAVFLSSSLHKYNRGPNFHPTLQQWQ